MNLHPFSQIHQQKNYGHYNLDSMELGYGNMNLEALVEQAKAAGVDAVILESHKNWVDKSPVKSIQLSAEFMKKYV